MSWEGISHALRQRNREVNEVVKPSVTGPVSGTIMASHAFSTKPLYVQVRDALAERIATGQWKSGTSIPNEKDLAREFGVSAGTMGRFKRSSQRPA